MKQIKKMTKEDLLMSSVDLISKTYIELGQNNIEEDTIMIMSQSLAEDLYKTYKNFYFDSLICIKSKIFDIFINHSA